MANIPTEILKHIATECKLLVVARSGSQGYNLAIKTSDDDLIAIFIVPLSSFLKLQKCYTDTSFGSFEIEGNKHDFTFREITAFAQLLLESNPNIVESLYFTTLVSDSAEWNELCSKRNYFLTQKFLSKYIGHAVSALRPDNKGIYSAKGVSHALRVLWEADRMIQRNLVHNVVEGPIVYLSESNVEPEYRESLTKRRQEVLRVKSLDENQNQAELKQMATNLKSIVKELDTLIPKTTFPQEIESQHVTWLNGTFF